MAILQKLRGIAVLFHAKSDASRFKPHEIRQLGPTPRFGRFVALLVGVGGTGSW